MNSIANIKEQDEQFICVNLTESPPGNEFPGGLREKALNWHEGWGLPAQK